ncbi:hypothetical protein [uncultured Psychroserpens sp.]|uniref:hypothetical protein n=1 Tax=uncultured Psychroserpens sp. TaxID=255436 RepID=UPI002602E920|nr:hypothetical protein [uncultured Psychroserpens sp.]
MLEILLIIFIGRSFFRLAEEHNQNKWVFAILGVVSYYVAALIGGVLLGIADEVFGLGIDWENTLLLTIIALPIALGAVYLLYSILKKAWKKNVVIDTNEIQDIGKNSDNI